jgi:hypothetical protein
VSARRRLRAGLAAGAIVGLTALARADAPSDQYSLFNMNDDVIVDAHTGLRWQRVASATAVDYADAFGVCASLSLDTSTTGWRVPSYKELLTLVDEAPHTEYVGGALTRKWVDPNAFPATAVDLPYWTSSTYPYSAGSAAYAVSFHTGAPLGDDTILLHYVRCVHD